MTLVIARATSRGIRILSDIRVSHPEERRHGLPYGVLKAVVLNENLCVCFAGSVALGAPAIAELARNGDAVTPAEAVAALRKAHQRNVPNSEFIVARRDPPGFWKIANDRVEDDQPATWIGDHTAFSRFQEIFLGPPLSHQLPPEFDPDGALREASQLMDAYRAVLDDATLDSVGDARVVVAGDADGFRYLPYMEIDNGLDPPSITAGPGEEVDLIRAGSAAIGAFAFSVLVPVNAGVGLVAMHVLQASLGFVYYPAESTEALILRDVTALELIDRIGERYGVVVSGILFGVPEGYEPPPFNRG